MPVPFQGFATAHHADTATYYHNFSVLSIVFSKLFVPKNAGGGYRMVTRGGYHMVIRVDTARSPGVDTARSPGWIPLGHQGGYRTVTLIKIILKIYIKYII